MDLNFKARLRSEDHILVGVKVLSFYNVCPVLGLNLHYCCALGLCIRMITTALIQWMLELDVKVLLTWYNIANTVNNNLVVSKNIYMHL